MHHVVIPEKDLKWELPEDVSEMTSEQYRYFLNLSLESMARGMTVEDIKTLLVYEFLGLNRSYKSDQADRKFMNIGLVGDLFDDYFVSAEVDGKKVMRPDLEQPFNLWPRYRHRSGWVFIGPEDGLANWSFGNYIKATNLLNEIQENRYPEELMQELARLMYKPWGFNQLPSWLPKINFPTDLLWHCVYFLQGSISWITTNPAMKINNVTVNMRKLFNKNAEGRQDVGMLGVLFAIAESNVFGPMDQAEKQGLYTVLLRLYQIKLREEDNAKK